MAIFSPSIMDCMGPRLTRYEWIKEELSNLRECTITVGEIDHIAHYYDKNDKRQTRRYAPGTELTVISFYDYEFGGFIFIRIPEDYHHVGISESMLNDDRFFSGATSKNKCSPFIR